MAASAVDGMASVLGVCTSLDWVVTAAYRMSTSATIWAAVAVVAQLPVMPPVVPMFGWLVMPYRPYWLSPTMAMRLSFTSTARRATMALRSGRRAPSATEALSSLML